MRNLRRIVLLRGLFAGVVPFLFLFISVVPALAATPSIIVSQTCSPGAVRPGREVTCTATVTNLRSTEQRLRITDIVTGGGLYPDTAVVQFGGQISPEPSLNQLNRQEYGYFIIVLTPLSTQTVPVKILPFRSREACLYSFWANMNNEIRLSPQAGGPTVATARSAFSASCAA